ncbi:HlyD family efflux transporter periplasmic adaptor subunit [Herbaspirillum lusitanum]|uniref:efflux RND transporter periplasmic adaptor subunit n=1 Tax=Herbaspirillum lusitanum TaxID=213312 RepID=UPI0022375575|nr:HlyD family efflux transporter periplasmic adaptor subunit [Herbaspirillum lusitanum]MCW5300359.1 HlyD family efflux transporter periplasmic adaptor subunit [Herbaspirillum lusitanum]
MNAGPVFNPLLSLLELAQRARAAGSVNELAFLAVNDSRALAPYRQSALWFGVGGIHTLSGVVAVESNAPYVQWLTQLCRALAEQHGSATPVNVDPAQLPTTVTAAWDEWLPQYVAWVPLRSVRGATASVDASSSAGLLLAGDSALGAEQLALLAEWMDIWQHAWRTSPETARWSAADLPQALRNWWRVPLRSTRWRRRAVVAAAVLGILLFPVHLSVLAPGELVAANPATIRAPLDGVIAEFAVRPNQTVTAGQSLFSFDQAPVASKLDVAREALATAQAEYRQAAQLVLNDPRAKAQLAGLLGRVAEKQAQAAFLEGQAQRSRVQAPQAGIALFDDPSEWIGRPVQTGERIMQIAAPNDVEIEAWVPIGDAIPLPDKAPLHLYLSAAPMTPLSGTLRYMGHRATARPDGTYAYRVRAKIDGATAQRIGLKGTAKLVGDRVPLVYWMLRRPLASIRQFLAL